MAHEKDSDRIAALFRLAPAELEKEHGENIRFSVATKEQFDAYLASLDPQSKRVLEAEAAHRMGSVLLHARLDHELFLRIHRPQMRDWRERGVVRR